MADLTDDEIYAQARAIAAGSELRETDKAFADTRQGLLEVIATSAIGELDLREKCFLAVQTLDRVRTLLMTIASGKAIVEHSALIRGILGGADQAEA